MIQVSNLRKSYGSSIAVDDLSFRVAKGQVLGLVGPNGAGKTTTLRALTGIVEASGGQLIVNGHDVQLSPLAAKQSAAYVPDDPQLFNELTVDEHLAFIASVYRVRDASQKIDALLQKFNLEFKRVSRASDLSRGMRQKLAICCAYLYDPSAILLDEPMTGLDPHGIRVLKQSVAERAENGAAIVISSHLLAMVEDICTHVLILAGGQKRFCGTIDELRAAYQSGDSPGSSLEDIFFEAVQNQAHASTQAFV